MKKFIVMALMASAIATKAQVSVQINIGSQPQWGPVGYNHVDYYYLPDIETYYYVPKRQFVYLNNGNWMFSNSLPARYRNYDLYHGYKVVVNRERPYLNYNSDRIKYKKYQNWGGKQKAIKYSKDRRYSSHNDNGNHGRDHRNNHKGKH
ncbi:MAG: hypothetical protein V4541_12750 [Bacteroidota bacterium]